MFQGLVLGLFEEVVPCVGLEVEAWGTDLHEAEEDHSGEFYCFRFVVTGCECSERQPGRTTLHLVVVHLSLL
jgi:hypothetical protein